MVVWGDSEDKLGLRQADWEDLEDKMERELEVWEGLAGKPGKQGLALEVWEGKQVPETPSELEETADWEGKRARPASRELDSKPSKAKAAVQTPAKAARGTKAISQTATTSTKNRTVPLP